MPLEAFGVYLQTEEGYALAAGGLCMQGHADRWRRAFASLRSLRFPSDHPFAIDYHLAGAIEKIGETSLLAAGATVCIPHLSARLEEKTGGVLGMVGESALGAENGLEEPYPGLWLYTVPGGPGFLLESDRETASAVMQKWDSMGSPEKTEINGEALQKVIESFGGRRYLIVSDGTGKGAKGYFAAADPKGSCSWTVLS